MYIYYAAYIRILYKSSMDILPNINNQAIPI